MKQDSEMPNTNDDDVAPMHLYASHPDAKHNGVFYGTCTASKSDTKDSAAAWDPCMESGLANCIAGVQTRSAHAGH